MQTKVDGEVVQEDCQTDEQSRNSMLLAMGAGLAVTVLGAGAVWRYSDGTNPVADVVSGAVLLLVGVCVTCLFGAWLWDTLTTPTLREWSSWSGLVELLAFTAMGLSIAVLGSRGLWQVVLVRRRRQT
ncbi:hypothetical protein [Halopelagius longus]|nr:hypothetical protein [Halopelagius longus]